ncbi:MAG: aminotransferase class V-fold PLP-dependent enzyme [Caulobacteraceae bacterium]
MIYLDNAATTYPKPEQVYTAVDECLRKYCANPGRGGHKLSLQASRVILEARELVAELFKINSPDRVVFTNNATDSLNLALKGYLKDGDHVITTSMEHNSMLRPLKSLESLGVDTTIVQCSETGEVDIKDIEKEIRGNTTLIAVTHASNVIGTIMPIAEIGALAKRNNLVFLVDAAQTAGVYDIDVDGMNIDLLAFAGHKSLLGPQGTGGLYIREGIELHPMKEGGTGSKSESLYQPEILPDRYESGTPNTPGISGLCAGLKFIKETGIEKIRKHEVELCSIFLEELGKLNGIKIYGTKDVNKQAPVVSINIGDAGSSEISYILDEAFDIATRPGLHCAPMAHKTINTLEQGTVRFSMGYFNTVEDIKAAVAALDKIMKEL